MRKTLWSLSVFVGLCSAACSEPSVKQETAAQPEEPAVLTHRPTIDVTLDLERAHEPGHLAIQCILRDADGDLAAARITGPSKVSEFAVSGHVDTITAVSGDLVAGEHEIICEVVDSTGQTSADTVVALVLPNQPPAGTMTLTGSDSLWTITQKIIDDPDSDTVQYAIVIDGPMQLVIGPRFSPIDTVISFPEGRHRVFAIVFDGFAADTTLHLIEHAKVRPTVRQSVERSGVVFQYTGHAVGVLTRLTVIRAPRDTIYHGAVPADTTFAGLTEDDRSGLPKGTYAFHLFAEAGGQVARSEATDTIPDLVPTVDLSSIDAALDLDSGVVLALPEPADSNHEDAPNYTRARSLDGRVYVALSGSKLTITPVAGSSGPYTVELTVGDASTGVLVDTLRGTIEPKPISDTQAAPQDTARLESGYANVTVVGGATSVGADLVDDDEIKNPLLSLNAAKQYLGWYYTLKRELYDKTGIAAGVDYSFLNQYSNYSITDTQAASGVFRVFATWRLFGHRATSTGTLVLRIENRHLIGTGITPRDLGFDGGSSLSSATFKSFDWGLTNLYWKQTFAGTRYAFVVGRMDPGDYSDVYLLLTAYKAFLSDAYFNNPSVALPQQGLGIAGRATLIANWYVAGGLHDANGSPTHWGFETFFKVREYYTWIETGWVGDGRSLDGRGIHLNLWHQDARKENGTDEAWGATLSVNKVFHGRRRWSPFFRAGYSKEDGGQLVRFVAAAGLGVYVRGSDLVGLATSLSGPLDKTLRHQVTSEAFYRLQFARNLAITPSIQVTINPSQTLETDALWVVGLLRLRLAI